MRVDTHVHFWKYDKAKDDWITSNMKTLQQDYLPQTIEPSFKRNGIDGAIAVQTRQEEVETLFLVELAKTHPVIKGVVGWVDLRNERVTERLQYFSQFPIIKGWRHIVQAEADDFLLGQDFQRGIQALQPFNYTYDILIYPRQLPAALELVSRFPQNRFVIDHCAKPGIANGDISEWATVIKKIGAHPNVYCKLSGLLTEAKWKQWSPDDFYPYLDTVFEAFGAGRLLFGSDWPVMLLSGIYVQWKSLLEKYMEHFTAEETDAVFGTNAIEFYGLTDLRTNS